MADVVAKDLATFIVEPVGSDINNPASFTVGKRFQDSETTTSYTSSQITTMFDDIMDEMSRPTASSSNMRGGLLCLNNGTYLLDSAGIDISDATDGPNVSVRIIGESRDKTILKCDTDLTNDKILQPACSLEVDGISFNGNGTTMQAISPLTTTNAAKILKVRNCRFNNFADFDILIGHNQHEFDLSESIFENHQVSNDQCAFECIGWASIHDNYFEKTSGNLTGESLTTGTVFNCHIYNNIINRTTHDNGGISMEAFDVNDDNANVHIHSNMLINAGISIGSVGGPWSTTFRNVTIDSNALYGGGIRIVGPNTGDQSTQIKDWSVMNNTISNPYEHGIKAYRTAGGIIRNNKIYNSNTGLDSITGSKGCLHLEDTIDVICEDNRIYMGVTSPESALFSPYGIKYIGGVNLTLRNNRIMNKTLANPSYTSSGSQTGTTLISRSS
jgi:hypothetical protein